MVIFDIVYDQNKTFYFTQGGYYWASTVYYHQVFKLELDGKIDVVAGTGIQGFSDGPGNSATFSGPFALALRGPTDIYVAEHEHPHIRKVSKQ